MFSILNRCAETPVRPYSDAMTTGGRFVALDGLRGLAAFGVLSFHVVVFATSDYKQLDALYLCVDFFFVLSGFVLLPSMPRQRAGAARASGVFILKRIFRFWPLVIISVVLALVLLAIERQVMLDRGSFDVPYGSLAGQAPLHQVGIVVAALLLLQIVVSPAMDINVPLWSLSAEWFANLIYTPATLTRWSLGVIDVIIVGYALLWFGLTNDASFIDASGPIRGTEALGRALIGFGFGLLLRLNFDRLAKFRNWWLLVIAIAAVASFYFIEKDWHWDSYRYAITYFAAPVFAFLILQVTRFDVDPRKRWGRFLEFAGAMSFGVYVFHVPLIQFINVVFGTPSGRLPASKWVVFFLSEGVAVTVACIALTVLMRMLWERPIQRWGSRVIARVARKGGDN